MVDGGGGGEERRREGEGRELVGDRKDRTDLESICEDSARPHDAPNNKNEKDGGKSVARDTVWSISTVD